VRAPVPMQTLVHVHAGAEELGRVYQAELMINASMPPAMNAFASLPRLTSPAVENQLVHARADLDAWRARQQTPGDVQMWDVIGHLDSVVPGDTIVTNGAGNYAGWVGRFHSYRCFRSQLAPTSGAMGYGVPAAIAAKAVHRDRTVICFAGDGCFLMSSQELATAIHHELQVVFIVVNNGMYGTIRMHQEREYPGRVLGTSLTNPDFAAYARSFGAHGETVTTTADFPAALGRALHAGRAALIELRIDPEAITPNATLSAIRSAAQERNDRTRR
jgi:acetolactate synthase I/II/III large subunit